MLKVTDDRIQHDMKTSIIDMEDSNIADKIFKKELAFDQFKVPPQQVPETTVEETDESTLTRPTEVRSSLYQSTFTFK